MPENPFLTCVALVGLAGVLVALLYQRVGSHQALVVRRLGGTPRVAFDGALVVPVLHVAEVVDLAARAIALDLRGDPAGRCKDGIRADLELTFTVRVDRTAEGVLKAVERVGAARLADAAAVEALLRPRLVQAVAAVVRSVVFDELSHERAKVPEAIALEVGDLGGFLVDNVAITSLAPTPLDRYDAHDVLDAEGTRRITERLADEAVRTSEIRARQHRDVAAQGAAAAAAVSDYERTLAELQARRDREIAEIRARAEAEVELIRAEERARAPGGGGAGSAG